jgi:enoyl-CoA hydratase/carnithine racemase
MDGLGAESLPTRAFSLATPVVTAVNGPCVGIGMLLALCADVRFAAPSATFVSAFSRLGLVAEYGMAWVLPRLIGLGAATEVLLSGRIVSATEAKALGLVTEVVDDPLDAARAWAADIAANVSPDSIRAMKAQLLQAQHSTLGEAVEASLVAMRASVSGPDLAEAMLARRDGRPPEFTGGHA